MQNEQNEAGSDEGEEYKEENEVQNMLLRSFTNLRINVSQIWKKLRLNIRDEECVKEVKICVHLIENQRRDLIHFLRGYIDVFVWV